MRGNRSNKWRNASGEIWNPEGKRTFNKPDWWDDKIPDPANSKGKQKKKIKKTTEKELEDAAKQPDSSEVDSEENATSREASEPDIVDRKVKKATSKKE